MSDPSSDRVIDRICTRFEQAWLAGGRPRIEDFLAEVGDSAREGLLKELLLLEIWMPIQYYGSLSVLFA